MGSLLFPGPLVGGSPERSEISELPASGRDSKQRREALLGERNLPEVRGQPGAHCRLVQRGELMPSWAGTFAYSNVPPANLDLPVSEARDDGDSKHAATGSAILVGLWLTLNGSMYRLQRFPRALGIDVTPYHFHYFVKVREGPLLEPRWERQVTQLV